MIKSPSNSYLPQLLVMLAVISVLIGCDTHRHDPRLEKIAEYVANRPRDAILALDSINPHQLNAKNRAYYNLLSIKARDKAYITHTSDSLIQTVIDYYTHNKNHSITPEALYYGGRVYSDLGDYPTSLNYFQQALDLLPEGTDNEAVRSNVISQTGGLLMDIGMFQQSVPYIKEAISINAATFDTLNLAYDTRLLGSIYMKMHQYDSAEYYFQQSLRHVSSLYPDFKLETQVYQAANKYEQEDFESALVLIRPTVNKVDSLFKSYTLATAAKIYYESDINDSAYMYSHMLAMDKKLANRKTGYWIMLSPKLRQYLPTDSMEYFFAEYKRVLEESFRELESDELIMQHSRYNYQMHDRKRREAEEKSRSLTIALLSLACAILGIIIIALFIYIRNRNKIIELQKIINDLNKLAESLNHNKNVNATQALDHTQADNKVNPESNPDLTNNLQIPMPTGKISQQSLKEEIKSLLTEIQVSTQSATISDRILKSDAYRILRNHIERKTLIPDSENKVWDELERIVLEESPNFISRLQLLLGGKIDEQNLRMALLIKSGASPAQTDGCWAGQRAQSPTAGQYFAQKFLVTNPRLIILMM
ncbi:MAG: tetratricopeptide repeat protein [Bacteroides sp.]|nr:tetratricopeptide repeat protein [Bacteroides sp.]